MSPAAVERELGGRGAVFSTLLWSRKLRVSGSWSARSCAVALSESLPVRCVSPKLIRIAVASWSLEAGLGPGDRAGVLVSGARRPALCPRLRHTPRARWSRARRGGMRDAVSSGRIAAVDGQGDAVYEAGAGAA